MQILQIIKRQSTVRTFQEIYSYWKGNKCLTWNGYNENFDTVSQQEILSLKTSVVSILPSSLEKCHSGFSSHFYFNFFLSFFSSKSWKRGLVMRTVLLSRCLLSSPGLLIEPFMSWNSIHISTSIFMLFLENQLLWTGVSLCCWEISWFGQEGTGVSLLCSLFLDMLCGVSMHTSYSVVGSGVLLLRPSPPGRTIPTDLHYFPK